jgi:hypothetical protein
MIVMAVAATLIYVNNQSDNMATCENRTGRCI